MSYYRKSGLTLLVCFVIYFLPQNIFSDSIDKANKYYDKYDYKFAIAIYEKIMLKKPSLEAAQKLANCYRFINSSEQAEKAYAKVFSFEGFDAINYKYYADVLKENGKFNEAQQNYLEYAARVPEKAEEAKKMANSCDAARMWADNPDVNMHVENELALNSEYSDFAPVKYKFGYVFVSDRLFVQEKEVDNENQMSGWTGNPYLKLYEADLLNPVSAKIKVLPKLINNTYHNGPATFTADGNGMYFTRIELDKNNKGRKYIYYSAKTGEDWGEPQLIPFNKNKKYSVQHTALSPDGTILYFASDMPGGLGGMDLYAARKQENGTWGEPQNCGENVNTAEDEVFPSVRANGQLYFSSKGHIGMGGLDIFTAKGSYTDFSVAENLKSPLNSTKDDFGILFINDQSGFVSSNRKGGRGLDDIYRFNIIPVKVEKPLFVINGQSIDKTTGLPLNDILIVLINISTGKEISAMSGPNGKFRFELEENMSYVVKGDSKKFYSKQADQISTKDVKESTIFNVMFELEKSEDAYLVHLDNIYYDFNKWDLRADAAPELNKVISFMNSMPDVKIQLRSHTDSRGTDAYNLVLSQKRAQSAVGYLENGGVQATRLTAIGLGETESFNTCKNGTKCSEEEHQLNRRTEFKVIKAYPASSVAPLSLVMANLHQKNKKNLTLCLWRVVKATNKE